MDGVVCIDIGSVNAIVKFRQNGYEEYLDFNNGETFLPIVGSIGKDMIFGKFAKLCMSSGSVITNLKQLIGKTFEDVVVRYRGSCLQKFNVTLENRDGELSIPVNEGEKKYYKPYDVLRALFSYLFKSLMERCQMNITKTVITIPTRFNDDQRNQYMKAASEAGFQGVYLLNESVAATLAFMKRQNIFSSRTVLVFDFGGGSCDISILQVSPNASIRRSGGIITVEDYSISILATSELPKGGDDVDRELMDFVLRSFRYENPRVQYISMEDNKQDYYNLLSSVSQMKERGGGEVYLDGVINNIEIMDKTSIELTMDTINSVVKKYMNESMMLLKDTVARAFASIPERSRFGQIHMVIPVGGMCNMKCVIECLEEAFGRNVVSPLQPKTIFVDGGLMNAPNPCYRLKNFESITSNVCFFGKDFRDVIIPKGTRLPFVKMKFFKPELLNQEWIDTKFYIDTGDGNVKAVPIRFRNRKEEDPFMITVEVNSSFDADIYVSFFSTREKEHIQSFILNYSLC